MGIAARRIKSDLSNSQNTLPSMVELQAPLALSGHISPTHVLPSLEIGSEKRTSPRFPAKDISEIILPGKKYGTACLIHDISDSGAKLETSLGELPKRFVLVNYTRKTKTLCSLVWHKGRFLGVNFLSEPRTFTIE